MKILFLASTFPRFLGDGSGRFIQSLAEAVQKLGHDVYVLAPYHPLVEPFESAVKIHHFRYIWRADWHIMGYAQAMQSDQKLKKNAYLLAPLYFLSASQKVRQLQRKHSFDIIHVHWVIPNGPVALPISNRYKLPLIVSLHGSDMFFALRNAILGLLTQKVFLHASAVTACSPDLERAAIQLGASATKTHLLPWGADPSVFKHQQSTAVSRQGWLIPVGVPVLLSLGRLVRKKGLEYLIKALPDVLAAYPQTLLLIAGSGPELTALQNLGNELGVWQSIRFLGDVPWQDVPDLLAISDLFVVPSIHDERGNLDGLPTTILEAMAAACPIVATAVAGIPLAIQHEVNGLLVPETDPVALAEAITRLLGEPDLARKLGLAGQDKVVNELNWINVAKHFEHLYIDSLIK